MLFRNVLLKLAGYAASICILLYVWAPRLFQDVTGHALPAGFDLGRTLIGSFATVFGVLVALFNMYGWRTKVGRALLTWAVPDIHGTWRGTLKPTALLPSVQSGRLNVEIPTVLVVRQSAFTLCLTLFTEESHSVTVASEFIPSEDPIRLVYSYYNTPQMAVRGRSPLHHGTAILHMSGPRPGLLEGEYFTDRLSRGDLRFEEHSRDTAASLQDAQHLTFTRRSR